MAAGGVSNKSGPMTEEKKNALRFFALTMDLGTDAVRMRFDALVPPTKLSAHLKAKETDLEKLLKKRVLRPAQWDKLFPTASAAKSSDFDLTLLVCLIRNTTSETPPTKGWDSNDLPDAKDTSKGDDIARLRYYRNEYLAHKPVLELSTADFIQVSRSVIEAIDRLSGGILVDQAKECQQLEIGDDKYPDDLRKFLADHLFRTSKKFIKVITPLDDEEEEEENNFDTTNTLNLFLVCQCSGNNGRTRRVRTHM